MQALVLIALFDRNDGAIDGVHFDFQQRAIGLQQADLIDKLAVLGFKLQLNHLARILFFHLVQYGAQGQRLPGFGPVGQCLARRSRRQQRP